MLVAQITVVMIQQCDDCTNPICTLLVLAQGKERFCPGYLNVVSQLIKFYD